MSPTAGATASGAPGRHRRVGLVEGTLVLGLAAGVWLAASRLPEGLVEGQPSPGAWPRALALCLGLLGTALLVEAARGRATRADATLEAVNPAQWPALAATVLLSAGFLVAWPWLGYLPSALVSFPLLARVVGVGSWRRSIGSGAGLALLTWGLFSQLLSIPL